MEGEIWEVHPKYKNVHITYMLRILREKCSVKGGEIFNVS